MWEGVGAAEKAGGEGGEGVEWVCLDLDLDLGGGRCVWECAWGGVWGHIYCVVWAFASHGEGWLHRLNPKGLGYVVTGCGETLEACCR